MDQVLKRLDTVEASVSEIKAQVTGLTSQLPHLATKADIANAKASIIQWMVGTMLAAAGLAFAIAKSIH